MAYPRWRQPQMDSTTRVVTCRARQGLGKKQRLQCLSLFIPCSSSFVGYGGHFRVSPKNQQKFKDRVREITRRNRGVSMSARLLELRRYFQGWVGYFSLVPMKTYFEILDKWVRRRIRSCYWKQWRNPRTRIRNLRTLGVRGDQSVTHGFSSKGAWVMSSSQAVHEALSIAYLTQEGLVSLLTIWQKLTARN